MRSSLALTAAVLVGSLSQPLLSPAGARADAAPIVSSTSRGTAGLGGTRATTLATKAAPRPARRLLALDAARRLDTNQLNLFVANDGSLAYDIVNGTPGLIFPKGTNHTAVFAAGLWLGALVDGQPRVTVAEYTREYAPGAIVSGAPEDPDGPSLLVFKLARWTGDPADSAHVERTPEELAADPYLDPLLHHSWSEYMAEAAPRGAPVRIYRLPDPATATPDDSIDVPGPDVAGDQMLWCVFNDADPSLHVADAGSTAPLGVEVRQTVYAFDRPGPLATTAFVRYQVIHRGTQALQDVFAGAWSDPDIGGFADDLAGCDPARSLGFMYNGAANDAIYGPAPPAVGWDLLDAPADASPGHPLHAFQRYVNGLDPQSAAQSYFALLGLAPDGAPVLSPITGAPTRYPYDGDPLSGTGWRDASSADRRLLLATAPFTLDPGDTAEVTVALLVGAGSDRLASLGALTCNDDFVQEAWASGFAVLEPADPLECPTVLNCPRASSFWQQEANAPARLTPEQLERVAIAVDSLSRYFEWTNGTEAAELRAALTPTLPTTARTDAIREYAGLLANVAAAQLEVREVGGEAIFINDQTRVSCVGVPDTTLASVLEPVTTRQRLQRAYYDDVGPHPPALLPFDRSLEAFGGGAGYGMTLYGSTLDPSAQPDSFGTVQIRFDSLATQKAYRYLWLQKADGTAPPQGRGWIAAGFRDVPFTVRDVARDVQLECAFLEETLVDADGTILPAGQQAAAFDSSWAPDDSPDGAREFILVFRRDYTGAPDPSLAVSGALGAGTLPLLYALLPRRADPAAVIDPGDSFVFEWGRDPVASFDAYLYDLEHEPLEDPAVLARYQDLAACAQSLNQGLGIGATCSAVTPVLASRTSATATADGVALAWHVPGGASFAGTIERSDGIHVFSRLAAVTADGAGVVRYEDPTVAAGERYGYRLRSVSGALLDEVWVEVPRRAALALAGFRPHPAVRGARLAFTLATASPVTVDLVDVAGRRVASRTFSGLAAGAHAVRIEEADRLPAGVYLVRLRQGAAETVGRAVLIR